MGKKQDDMPSVSATSTKKEILDAYNQMKQQLETLAAGELRPEVEKEARRKKEVVGLADDLSVTKISGSIDALKAEINASLLQIAGKLEESVGKYIKAKEAVGDKEKELEELFGIEHSAYSLAALIEAQRQKKMQFERDMSMAREELEEEISRAKTTRDQEQAGYDLAMKEQKELDQKLRKREQEEYDYNLKRERELKIHALHDEVARLEGEIAEKRQSFDKATAIRDEALQAREKAVAAAENEMVALQVRVDNLPRELDEAIRKAVKETSERLTSAAEAQVKLQEKTFEGEKNVLVTRIEALEQLAGEQRKQIDQLSAQLEKAYGKVQDIAVKAVSGQRERYYAENSEKHATGE
ncbi:MAG: hypothetical protein BWK76_00325 [Desulfobulbaceae bacterium A2]|nr:MAG: hypothetical protein BWK76_00325 [Desulfobulbaceae bacterium A2]